jgi:hypothetical protein
LSSQTRCFWLSCLFPPPSPKFSPASCTKIVQRPGSRLGLSLGLSVLNKLACSLIFTFHFTPGKHKSQSCRSLRVKRMIFHHCRDKMGSENTRTSKFSKLVQHAQKNRKGYLSKSLGAGQSFVHNHPRVRKKT